MSEFVLNFKDWEVDSLERYGYSSELLTVHGDTVYYNNEYICTIYQDTYVIYLCLISFLRGYHIGFDRGEDTCYEYMNDQYILINKSVCPQDLPEDLDDFLIPEELKQ